MSEVRVAISQAEPVHLSLEKSLEKLLQQIENASENGAKLIVLGESWLSGYPAWIDYCEGVALWDEAGMKEVYHRLHESSVTIPGKEIDQICQRAKAKGLTVCLGVNEKVERGPGTGTVYNSLVIVNEGGEVAIHHRKLMPTFSEKLVYGIGDGKDLDSVRFEGGQVGGLICWEHWMPLARQAMHNAGEHVHVALWPTVHEVHQMASRHYAFEGRCFVLAAGQLMKAAQIPPELKRPDGVEDNEYILRGGSCIIGPNGQFLVEPIFDKEEIILADIDPAEAIRERMTLDTSGHYQRSDVFNFEVDPRRK